MSKIVKGVLSANLAGAIRLARFGPRDATERLVAAYRRIDPFGGVLDPKGTDDGPCAVEMGSIREVELGEVIRGQPMIQVDGHYRYLEGAMPWCDIVPLLAILVDRAPRVVLEIGTFHGHTTRLLAINAPTAVIHTLDLPEDYDPRADHSPLPKDDLHLIGSRRVGAQYRSDPSVTNVVQHFGDSAEWDFGIAEGATFYLIDGAHTYEYVRSDTERALAAARGREATLVWHDVHLWHPEIVHWLAEMVAAGYPVKRLHWTHLAVMDVTA